MTLRWLSLCHQHLAYEGLTALINGTPARDCEANSRRLAATSAEGPKPTCRGYRAMTGGFALVHSGQLGSEVTLSLHLAP